MPEEFKRIPECADAIGRARDFEVVLHAPPPGFAKFHPGAIDALIDSLRAARLEAFTRRGGE